MTHLSFSSIIEEINAEENNLYLLCMSSTIYIPRGVEIVKNKANSTNLYPPTKG